MSSSTKKSFQAGERGATMVEAALSVQVFILVIVIAIELGMASYQSAALNYAVSQGTRWATLNQTIGAMNRKDSIENKVQELARPYGLALQPGNIEVCLAADLDPNTDTCATEKAETPGGKVKEEYIQIKANYPSSLLFGAYQVDLTAKAFGRNEP